MQSQYVTNENPTVLDVPRHENAVPDGPRNGALHATDDHALAKPSVVSEYQSDEAGASVRTLAISLFARKEATAATVHHAPLEGLAPLICQSAARSKGDLPLLSLSLFFGSRSAANVEAVEGIEADYDGEKLPVDWAVARLADSGLRGLVVTSPSHTDDAPRWRVFMDFSRTLGLEERERCLARLNGVLGGILDPSSFNRGQAFYYGRVEGRPVPDVIMMQGDHIDLRDDLDSAALDRDGKPYGRRADTPQPEAAGDDDDPFSGIPAKVPATVEEVRLLLSFIDSGDHDTWFQVGMHLRDLLGDDGYAEWDAWSQTSPNYGGLEKRWRSFRGDGNPGRAFGALRKFARAGGWSGRFPDPDVARLNARHALVMIRGKALVATERADGGTDFGPVRDLHALYANDRVEVTEKRTEAVSAKWLRDLDRRTYADGVEFAPGGAPPGVLNLWRGWAVEPDPKASCARFLEHVRAVVCGGNRDHAEYVLGWLAHMVQRPQEKPGVALVLRGPKGAGKDSVGEYVSRMIGRRHAPTVAQSEHITGRFNARMENALFFHVQEGAWAGDRKAEEVLKYLVTSEFVEIERKGIDSINLRSVLRLFISANAEWVVPASRDERRWAVFEVADSRAGDDAYFRALRAEMNGDGPAALLHFLRSYDLSRFNVRKAPQTEGLRNQKIASLRGLHRWWFEVLHSGEIGTYATDDEGEWEAAALTFGREELRNAYVLYMRGRRYDGDTLDSREFGRALRDMLPSLVDRRPRTSAGRVRQYVLPPLTTAREEFGAWLGSPIDWEAGA